MIKALKSNSGLSLMEILVAGLMFAILAVTVVMVISPIMMAYSRANSLAEYNTILDSIGNVITSEFSGANHVATDSGSNSLKFSSGAGDVTFSVDANGHLHRKVGIEVGIGQPVFPAGFYGGMQISFDVNPPSDDPDVDDDLDPDVFRIRVTISSNRPGTATAEISRDFAVRPIMLASG